MPDEPPEQPRWRPWPCWKKWMWVAILTLLCLAGSSFWWWWPVLHFVSLGRSAPAPALAGPESPALLERVEGTLVVVKSAGRKGSVLRVIELPELTEREYALDHQVDGPIAFDQEDRLYYFVGRRIWDGPQEMGGDEALSALRVFSTRDGTDTPVGDEEGQLGRVTDLAVSPEGDFLALAADTTEGSEVRILRLPRGETELVLPGTRDGQVSWLRAGTIAFDSSNSIRVIDLEPKKETTFEGFELYEVFPGGDLLLARSREIPLGSYDSCQDPESPDLDARFFSSIRISDDSTRGGLRLPGLLDGWRVLGVCGDGLALYEGLPTTGMTRGSWNSFARGPSSDWNLKVADVRTGEFCTLIPEVGFTEVYCYRRP